MDTTTQLQLISGGRSGDERRVPGSRPDWLIDDRTRQVGRQGVAEARAILARAQRPDEITAAGQRRAS